MPTTETWVDICETVKAYVEGMCQNDPAKLRIAMHEKACSIGHFDGGLEWDSREAFIAAVNSAVTIPDPAPWYVINSISVIGDMAIVHVEDIWLGERFDDALTLLKHEGRWVIASKVFFHRSTA